MKKKIPFVGQVQESECGICCASMVLKYYGVEISPREIEKTISVGRDGVDFNEIKDLFISLNFDTTFYECSSDQLLLIGNMPLILFWNNNHFVILEKIKKNKYVIIDPNLGRVVLQESQFIKCFSSIVLKVLPTEETKVVKSTENPWKLYSYFFKRNRFLFTLITLFSLASYMIIMYIPQIMQRVLDSNANIEIMSGFLLPMILLLIGFILVTLVRNLLVVRISSGLDTYTYKKIIEKIFSTNYIFFLTRNSSDLLYRITLNRANRDFFIEVVINGIIDAGMLLYISFILLRISSVLFIINTVMFILMSFILLGLKQKIILKNKEEIMANTRIQGLEYEALSAIFTVKGSGQEEFTKKNILSQYNESLQKFKERNYINNAFSIISSFFRYFTAFLIFIISFFYKKELGITIGQIVAINTLVTFFYSSSQNVFVAANSLGTIKNNILRILDIVEQPDEVQGNSNKIKVRKTNVIELNNVSFFYPGQKKYTLQNLTFTVEQGEKIAIVGETGSGKSTIFGLLLGLYNSYEGELSINGVDSREIDMYHYRENIGFVPQEPFIFNKSIKENICMGRHIEDEQVVKASKAAQIHEDICKMPMGYETIISESGHNISGGQKQRIIIARAIIRNPDLILLDEATSDVDNQTEKKISQYFKNSKTTQIVVAHRLSTVINSNKIIVLQNGSILAIGTHTKLLRTCDYYRSLYAKEDSINSDVDQEFIQNWSEQIV